MAIDRIPITDRTQWLALRKQDVTASNIAALFGVSDYMTPFELFQRKTGALDDEADEPAIGEDSISLSPLGRGLAMEPVALDLLRRLRPDWRIEPNTHYFRDPEARLGATPDLIAVDPERLGGGLIQVKCPSSGAFAQKWRRDGEIEPPLEYALQTVMEAHLAGASWAMIGVLTCGWTLDLRLIDVPIHAGIVARIRAEAARFWAAVEAGEPPAPDYSRDGALIVQIYSDDGSEVDLSGDERVAELIEARERLKAREADGDAAAKARRAIDAELIDHLRNAARARLADGRVISAKTVRRAGYTAAPSTYRAIKIASAK